MIKFLYPPVVIDKVKRILHEAETAIPKGQKPDRRAKDAFRDEREEWVRSRYGLGLGYLEGIIAGHYREPSGRVLKNLGFDIFVRDAADETGQCVQVDFMGICDVDHSDPQNPKVILSDD